ncbi:hypothetical protein EVAR_80875_1 [Eumeta japonica]|uniref:Uncharacterized protein n=1 Tax=Eumeta variegata TaxID=151549 RepID=A0A4C1V0T2_EUMVA|nr:hypothetical protein EVAR_80875_1 [Eumeta japonica]
MPVGTTEGHALLEISGAASARAADAPDHITTYFQIEEKRFSLSDEQEPCRRLYAISVWRIWSRFQCDVTPRPPTQGEGRPGRHWAGGGGHAEVWNLGIRLRPDFTVLVTSVPALTLFLRSRVRLPPSPAPALSLNNVTPKVGRKLRSGGTMFTYSKFSALDTSPDGPEYTGLVLKPPTPARAVAPPAPGSADVRRSEVPKLFYFIDHFQNFAASGEPPAATSLPIS